MEIKDVLDTLMKQHLNKHEIYSVVCNVDSVDLGNRSCICTPVNGGAEIQDVRIQASIGGTTGLFIEPVVDSKVVVTFLSKEIGFVSLFTDIENVYLDFNSQVIFNGGANGAMVKIDDLVYRMNLIENKINTMIGAFAAHVHVETGGSTSQTVTSMGASLGLTSSTDIDNQEIQQ